MPELIRIFPNAEPEKPSSLHDQSRSRLWLGFTILMSLNVIGISAAASFLVLLRH